MRILVLNTGSSSIKYCLYDMTDESIMAQGIVEQIGSAEGHFQWQTITSNRMLHQQEKFASSDHSMALQKIFKQLTTDRVLEQEQLPDAIGHRVVHGGTHFSSPTLISADVIRTIEDLNPLAPLQNPANVAGIKECARLLPTVPQVAIFDTAFHNTLPEHVYRYAIPENWYQEQGIRRYGFHGTSHQYCATTVAEWLGKPLAELNIISLHLGSGCSVAAIKEGTCIDTSMGLTPLEGLVMGSRSGDIDPAIPLFLLRQGYSVEEIEFQLNHESGLQGLCGRSDLREIILLAEADNSEQAKRAQLAIQIMVYRIQKYIGAYLAVLGGLDILLFTAGVGENSPLVRREVTKGLPHFGIELDDVLNSSANSKQISLLNTDSSRVKVALVPTNEQLAIARQTSELLLQNSI